MVWLVVVLGAVIALFAVPLRFRLKVFGEGWPQWQAEVVWLGGLVCIAREKGSFYFRLGGYRRNLPPAVRAGADGPRERPKGNILARLRGVPAAERRVAVRLVRELWAVTTFAVNGSFRYGCDDPAVTAWLHSGYYLLQGAGYFPGLAAEADFAQAGWSGRVEAGWSVRPLAVFVPVAKFLLTCAGLRIRRRMTGGKSRWQVET